jgi:ubiquinone/menaquinone biosynthesis C-methylase UbiE
MNAGVHPTIGGRHNLEWSAGSFTESIPPIYDRRLGPTLFEPYAADMGARLSALTEGSVLETASGTGIVTRELDGKLPVAVKITATDLNPAMIETAQETPFTDRVEWRQADALELPFADAAFGTVVCQFGAMFFPDKVAAYREARRVLEPGGSFIFSVWGSLEENPVVLAVAEAMRQMFPYHPPTFLERAPYGYNDVEAIASELEEAGFTDVSHEGVALSSRRPASDPAVGLTLGTPMRHEIVERDPEGLERAAEAATAEVASRFGDDPIDVGLYAHVFTAR